MKWMNLNTRYISITYSPVFYNDICSFVKYATFADFLPQKIILRSLLKPTDQIKPNHTGVVLGWSTLNDCDSFGFKNSKLASIRTVHL